MSTPIIDPRGYAPFGQPRSQVIDRGRDFSQVIDRGPAFSQVIDRGPQFSQVIDRGPAFGTGYTFGGAGVDPKGGGIAGPYTSGGSGAPPGGYPDGSNPGGDAPAGGGPAGADPFEAWYKDVIQANPNKYDTNRSKAQWQAWYPLWDASSQGFKSSKVDVNGNPIQGNNFEHPDACPPGMAAYGQNACAPVGYHAAGGGGGSNGFDGSGYAFGGAFPGSANGYPVFNGPTGADEQNDPGYQFRLKQGRGALEASAAARGTLATGGTLDAILRQGQDYASSEFGNVWNRYKDKYSTQVGAYQSAWDQYRFAQDEKFRQEQLRQQTEQYYAQIAADAAQG